LALTWTPPLSFLLVRSQRQAREHREIASSGFMGRVTRLYERLIRAAVQHPIGLGAMCVVLIAVSYACYINLGSDLLPAMDEGSFVLDYIMPAGASLQDTDKVLVGVEHIL